MAASTGGVGIAPPKTTINPGGVRLPAPKAAAPKAAVPKTVAPKAVPKTVALPARPPNPAIGGHYVKLGNRWQLIHAVAPGKWAKGPVPVAGPGVPLNSPILGNQPLSGQSRYDAAKAIADAQTVGPMSELDQQIAANNRQTQAALQTSGGYFNKLGQYNQLGVGLEGNIADALNTKLAQIGSDTQSQIAGTGLQAAAALQKYSPTETPGDTSLQAPAMSSLVSEVARQRGLAAQGAGAAQAAGATQGANYGSLAASNLGSQSLAGQQALSQIAQSGTVANQPLTQKIAGLQAQRGSLIGTALGTLRQQDINAELTREGVLGQNARAAATITAENQRSKASINAANTRAANTITAANTRQDKSLAAAEQKAAANAAATKNKPLTASENLSRLTDLGRAVSLYGQGRQAKLSPAQILQGLTTGRNPAGKSIGGSINPLIAQAALELWTYHFLNPRTAAGLHNLGIRGGTFQGKPIQVGGAGRGVASIGKGVGGFAKGVGNPFGK